jgi:hypothetical protein
MVTKTEIFNLFYSKQITTRKGGGTTKCRMARNNPSYSAIENMRMRVQGDDDAQKYFETLYNRDSRIAPPPKPEDESA